MAISLSMEMPLLVQTLFESKFLIFQTQDQIETPSQISGNRLYAQIPKLPTTTMYSPARRHVIFHGGEGVRGGRGLKPRKMV